MVTLIGPDKTTIEWKFDDNVISTDIRPFIKPSEIFSYFELLNENKSLKRIISNYEKRFEMIREVTPKVILVRKVPYDQAKMMIKEFIDEHKKGVYTTEIAEKLQLDIELVMKILSDLREEGKIAKVDERD